MNFAGLRLSGWRQFSSVEIRFDRRLTIITGANGAGKSTILNILIQHFGPHRPYLGVPVAIDGVRRFVSSVFRLRSRVVKWFAPRSDPNWVTVGSLTYDTGSEAQLLVPTQGQQSYSLQITSQQPVLGFHMPSHRNLPNYAGVASVAFGGIPPSQAFDRLINEVHSFYQGGHTGSSVLFRLKELLANWAVFGEGNSTVGSEESQYTAYLRFIEILKAILPPEIGFRGLKIEAPDVVCQTATGNFLIDSLSGGMLAMIEMAALIYTRSLRGDVPDGSFVVTMDEPENHLHPAMQRSLLPALMRAFPDVQFIVATHSPFVASSARSAAVYALKYESVAITDEEVASGRSAKDARRVTALHLDENTLSANPAEVLREVLGVPVSIPIWAEAGLDRIIAKYRGLPFNEATIAALRQDVEQERLSELFPEALITLGRVND